MNTRIKASLFILAGIGAVGSVQLLSSAALAQQGGGGFGGGQGPRRPMVNNMTATVTIDDAIKTATTKTTGYVNSANLRRLPPNGPPGGPPGGDQGGPPKQIWVIHVVTTPGAGPGSPGKGQDIAVDAASNQVVDMPPPPPPRGGFGGGGGGQGGPPPPPSGGG